VDAASVESPIRTTTQCDAPGILAVAVGDLHTAKHVSDSLP
jgi:hypothetical protein